MRKMTNKKDLQDALKYNIQSDKEKEGDRAWIKQEWDMLLPLDDSKKGEKR